MTPRPTPATRAFVLVTIALTLTGGLLTGCSSTPNDAAAEPAAGQSEPTTPAGEGSTAPDPTSSGGTDGFPSCDQVKAALGPAVEGLVEIADSDNGVATGSTGPALTCSWYTPETATDSTALEEYGFISLGISRDPETTEESMEPLGWNVDDPRVSGAGALALKVGGGYDPAAQVDATGVQIVRDGVVVAFASGGVALQDVPQLAPLTNDWALGAGVAVLDLMD